MTGIHPNRLRPGFRYPVHDARIDSGRLRFHVNPSDPFATWCEHQTSYKDTAQVSIPPVDDYYCTPSGGMGRTDQGCVFDKLDGSPLIPIDCGKAYLCHDSSSLACACSASGCTVDSHESGFTHLDAALDPAGAGMVGTLLPADSAIPRLTVRLTRH